MKKTVSPKSKLDGDALIRAYASELVGRARLSAKLGVSFAGGRSLYQTLGYPIELNYDDYVTKYDRQDMAAAIIDRPVRATWRGDLVVLESKDDKETRLEKEWKKLVRENGLKHRFVRLDKLACLGEYAVLLLGFNDVNDRESMAEPVKKGTGRKLLYARPVGQGNAAIKTWEKNAKDPRFGLPVLYELTLSEPGSDSTYVLKVHYTRILHVTVELLEDEISGKPILKSLYNRLEDLEKLVGGSAEMFWKGARPGYSAGVDKEYTMGQVEEDELTKQIDEFEHGLRRILMSEGLDLKSLAMQIADPSAHVDIQMQMISAKTGIPKRILVGSERGELASSQDQETWKELIQERREEYAEAKILIPFIDRMIEYGVLPPVQNQEERYTILWSDLFAPSPKEQSEIGKTKSEALKQYASTPMAEDIIPPEAFMEFFLGLDQEQINLIKEMREASVMEEEELERRMAETEEETIEEEIVEE